MQEELQYKVNGEAREGALEYIDTHSHIHFKDFDNDRTDMMQRMSDESLGTIAIGTDLETSKQVVELAKQYENIWACIGVHPNTHEDFKPNGLGGSSTILPECVVAVGECGLDYFRLGGYGVGSDIDLDEKEIKNEKERQKTLFKRQIEFAILHQLPLMLHMRSSNGESGQSTDDAHNDALEILTEYKKENDGALKLHCHFTTFGIALGKRFIALNATFGIPGVVTYKNAKELQELVQWLPLERILCETDAPYAAPVPHRGKRNEPVFVIDTVKAIATLRGEDAEVVRKQLLGNALRVFDIKVK